MTYRKREQTIQHFHNSNTAPSGTYVDDHGAFIKPDAFYQAQQDISTWPGYEPTPLLNLRGLAQELGISSLFLKHEGSRFGLGSFKALGGAYAISILLRKKIHELTGENADIGSLIDGKYRDITKNITVCSATAGNHGRSVAWGAQLFHCACVIYVPKMASQGRVEAISSYGPEVICHPENYDETVRHCATMADKKGWIVVSDTSYEGYTQIPLDIMSGYTVLAGEIISQLASTKRPTHVFVQGGVGGFASGVIAPLWHHWGKDRPRFIFITPSNAAVMLRSAEAGKRIAIKGDLDTVMTCLSCGELSLLTWQLLKRSVNDVIAIPDEAAIETMRTLAKGVNGDAPLVAGESGCAGIAGLIAVVKSGSASSLGLNNKSQVLCICTEGATDPSVYTKIVGRTPEQVMIDS